MCIRDRFHHKTKLVNHSGTKFNVGIDRTVKLLNQQDASQILGVQLGKGLRMVGYETDNRITNAGDIAWKPETGLLSIWILGMYNPSPKTTVVIPFKPGDEKTLGPKVNDTYFGKVPPSTCESKNKNCFSEVMERDEEKLGSLLNGPRGSQAVTMRPDKC